MSDNIIIEVNGLKLKENALYKVVDKPDLNAITGLREHGSTKVPLEFMGNSAECRFVNGVWDTGFYTQSPCYANLDRDIREQKVKSLREKIVEPYERVHGDGILDNKNSSFWENYEYTIFEGKIFNTESVDDLLELYLATLGFELTPKNLTGDPRFSSSQFCIEDKEFTSSKRNERAQNYMKAMTSYSLMLNSEKAKLLGCLKFSRMPGADSLDKTTPDSTFNSLFHDWINNDVKNVDDFVRAFELTTKKVGLEEVIIFGHLVDLVATRKVVKLGDDFTYNEVPLGPDLKSAAKNLATKTSLKDVKIEIYKELE